MLPIRYTLSATSKASKSKPSEIGRTPCSFEKSPKCCCGHFNRFGLWSHRVCRPFYPFMTHSLQNTHILCPFTYGVALYIVTWNLYLNMYIFVSNCICMTFVNFRSNTFEILYGEHITHPPVYIFLCFIRLKKMQSNNVNYHFTRTLYSNSNMGVLRKMRNVVSFLGV